MTENYNKFANRFPSFFLGFDGEFDLPQNLESIAWKLCTDIETALQRNFLPLTSFCVKEVSTLRGSLRFFSRTRDGSIMIEDVRYLIRDAEAESRNRLDLSLS